MERELEATDSVLGEPDTVLRFLADAVQRLGGELRPTGRPGVHRLLPGDLGARLKDQTDLDFPLEITLDARQGPDAEPVGRTHPLVAAVADEMLSRAFGPEPGPGFARAGAIFTDAVDVRTVLLLLRIRYLLREETGGAGPVESFAEIVLAACRRDDGQLRWLEPIDRAGRDLAERAEPTANMPQPEEAEHLAWALDVLDPSKPWYHPVIEHRVAALADAHARLRSLTKAPRLEIHAHEPPDVMGCFVLVPTGGTG